MNATCSSMTVDDNLTPGAYRIYCKLYAILSHAGQRRLNEIVLTHDGKINAQEIKRIILDDLLNYDDYRV